MSKEMPKNKPALCNWSPIRTAPKDGSLIWLGAGDKMDLGFYSKILQKGPRGGKPKKVGAWLLAYDQFDAKSLLTDFEPTHWQHIPNPPGA